MIRNEFRVHLLNEGGIQKAKALVERLIRAEGREVAIVRTKLEEASFFAKKAMASNPENQKPQ